MENAPALPPKKSPPNFLETNGRNTVVTTKYKSQVKILIMFFCSSFFLTSNFSPNTINNLNVA